MRMNKHNLGMTMLAAVAVCSAAAQAGTAIRDIARLQGARENKLMAYGLVDGLAGTGDGSKNIQAIRSLAAALKAYGLTVHSSADINANNVALVRVTAVVPDTGGREGDKLDVVVSAVNGAKSLKGGRLLTCPLLGPLAASDTVYALAEGGISLEGEQPTVGFVKGGAILEQDILPQYVAEGRIAIVLDAAHAGWAMASAVAKVINEDQGGLGGSIAVAVNPANVIVRIPYGELSDPADFIGRTLSLPVLMPDSQARIVINERTGTIVVTDDVEIDPVIISHAGLTITTVTPSPIPTIEQPRIESSSFVVMDPQGKGKANLKDLLRAFEQLRVPTRDQIDIIRQLQRTGRLHARVIEE